MTMLGLDNKKTGRTTLEMEEEEKGEEKVRKVKVWWVKVKCPI